MRGQGVPIQKCLNEFGDSYHSTKRAINLEQIYGGWRKFVFIIMMVLAPCSNPVIASGLKTFCPRELEPMVERMLEELPSFINRENTRADNRSTYVLLASAADFSALPLLHSTPSPDTETAVKQVFFTTLVRRYSGQETIYHQEHHWLFLAESPRGWEFVQLYSILDSYPSQKAPLPSRNSSRGSVAQALKNWLNNCRSSQQRGVS